MPESPPTKPDAAPQNLPLRPASLPDIFLAFAKIGLTSFGGGMSGWMLREFVLKRRWITEDDFLSGLALAQSFPGVNVVNLSIWIGFRLRGGAGALVGSLGIMVPPMGVAMALAAGFSAVSGSHVLHVVLGGVAAAAVGLSLQTGLRAAVRSARRTVPLLVMTLTFVALFVLRLPLLWVVGGMAPLSIAIAWWRLHTQARAT